MLGSPVWNKQLVCLEKAFWPRKMEIFQDATMAHSIVFLIPTKCKKAFTCHYFKSKYYLIYSRHFLKTWWPRTDNNDQRAGFKVRFHLQFLIKQSAHDFFLQHWEEKKIWPHWGPSEETENAFSFQPDFNTAEYKEAVAQASILLRIARLQISQVGINYVWRYTLQKEPAEGEST